jgi:hypothetical protein
MKKIYFITLAVLFFSCKGKQERKPLINFKYKIEGEVTVKDRKHPAIWMTDTFDLKDDSIIITNSDKSTYRIAPPYKIYRIK